LNLVFRLGEAACGGTPTPTPTSGRAAERGLERVEPPELDAEGDVERTNSLEALVHEEGSLQRRGSAHREVGASPEALLRRRQRRREERETQRFSCIHQIQIQHRRRQSGVSSDLQLIDPPNKVQPCACLLACCK